MIIAIFLIYTYNISRLLKLMNAFSGKFGLIIPVITLKKENKH